MKSLAPVIGSPLHDEINQARKELRMAEAQFAEASGTYIDSAVMKVNACRARLNCLYAEARNEGGYDVARDCQ